MDNRRQRRVRLRRKTMKSTRPPTKFSQSSQCAMVAYEYCSSASLHGLPWIARTRWPSVARPFWIAVVALGTALCIYMSCILWFRFKENATIFVVETINHPTVLIPFPTVMIRNSHQVYEPRTKNISELLLNNEFNESQIKYFFIENFHRKSEGLLPENIQMIKTLEKYGYDVGDMLKMIHQPCEAMLLRCAWRNIEINCSSMFYNTFFSEQYCCLFNLKHFRNSTKNLKLNYIAGFDEKQGLSVDLNISNFKDFDQNSHRNFAEIIIFNKERTVRNTRVLEGQQINVAIDPSLHAITDSVRMMSPDVRQCGYVDQQANGTTDPRLRHAYGGCAYHYYILYLSKLCSCVTAYAVEFDRVAGWEKFPICDYVHHECYKKAGTFTELFTELAEKGRCLVPCDDIHYDYTADYLNHDVQLKTNLSKINIYFQERRCKKYTRTETMTSFQLFAAFGGIFGLCLGGTVISVIELLWFITKFLSVIIFRCRPSKNSLQIKPKQIRPSSEVNENKSQVMLYLNELLPYGYSENRPQVLPEVIN